MSEPNILLEEWSPVCNMQAFVERTDSCCYFYLWVKPGMEDAVIKSCWICNVSAAPGELDVEGMKQGIAPAMPEEYVLHDTGGMDLNAESLKIVWFEEGNAAALLSEEEIICVIPGWGGYKGFSGYSRYMKGSAPCAWGLADALPVIGERVERSRAFWDWFEFEPDYWMLTQTTHMNTLEKFFGKCENYYAIDGEEFPPRALVRGTRDGVIYGITAGVSLIPMPEVEMWYGDDYRDHRRIELGFAVAASHEELCSRMYSCLSSLAAYPWKEITFLGHGHTIPSQVIKGYEAFLLVDPRLAPGLEMPEYESCREDPVNLLWVVPITGAEYQFAAEHDINEMLRHVKGDFARLHVFDGVPKFWGVE